MQEIGASTPELMIIIVVMLSVLMTFAWMLQHAIGAFSLRNDLGDISQRAQMGWLIGIIGGFTGLCVIPAAIVSGIIGFMELSRSDANLATMRAARVLIRTSATIVLMTAILVGVVIAATTMGR